MFFTRILASARRGRVERVGAIGAGSQTKREGYGYTRRIQGSMIQKNSSCRIDTVDHAREGYENISVIVFTESWSYMCNASNAENDDQGGDLVERPI